MWKHFLSRQVLHKCQLLRLRDHGARALESDWQVWIPAILQATWPWVGTSPLWASHVISARWACLLHRVITKTESPSPQCLKLDWQTVAFNEWQLLPHRIIYCTQNKARGKDKSSTHFKNCIIIPGSSLQSDFSPSGDPLVQPTKRH